jgi:Protein of unknown function (DUF1194)
MAPLSVSCLSVLGNSGERVRYTALASLLVIGLALAAEPSSADLASPLIPGPNCFAQVKRDVAFLIERSGSIARRGQTYNMEIKGLAHALRDPAMILRDGSIAVVVVLFNGEANIRVASQDPDNKFAGIDSNEQAEKIAAAVENPGCGAIDDPTAALPCPSGDTNFGKAISAASEYLVSHGRQGARRVLLMSTDGQLTDADGGQLAATRALADAKVSKLDAAQLLTIAKKGSSGLGRPHFQKSSAARRYRRTSGALQRRAREGPR